MEFLKNIGGFRQWFLSITIFLCVSNVHADIILQEDFSSGALPVGWSTNGLQGTNTWLIQNAPAFTSTSGGYYAVFNDEALGAGVTPTQSDLQTPSFDCSNRTAVYLNYQHHWYGVESTHGYVEISTNSGVTWTILMDYEKGTRGSLSAPQDTTLNITAFAANQSDVRVRFRYWDNSLAGKFWYVDDITIYSDPDVGVTDLIAPDYLGCGSVYGTTETVTVEVTNHGFLPVSNIPVVCNVSGGTIANLTGTIAGPIAPGATVLHTFAATINMSAQATYNFECYTDLLTDTYLINDSLYDSRQQVLNTFPYIMDFNGTNGGWFATGGNPPTNGNRNFVLGSLPYLNGPQGEGDSWFVETTSTNNGTWIWVESPVFDFSGLSSPQLYVDIKHQLHNSDYFRVEYSLNGGTTWVPLGSTEPNWYNTNGYWRNSIANPVDEWTKVQKSLCDLAGEPCVKFRFRGRPFYSEPTYTGHHYFAFDNVEIKDGPDVGIVAYQDPVNVGCLFSSSQIVTVDVYNYGCAPVSNVPVECVINGPTSTTLTGTVPGPIPPGASVSFTFPGTFDMSVIGTYDFMSYTNLATDIYAANDSLGTSILVDQLLVNTYPYLEDFNSGTGYWLAGGTNPPLNNGRQFVLGNIPYLNGPQGQGDSWYVETTVSNQGDWVWVESPVFDFSNLTNPTLTMDIKHQLHNSDYFQVQYSLDGGSSWQQLGNGPDPLWYNGNNYWRNSISAPQDTWLTVEQELCELSGEPCVKFRVRGRPFYSEPTYTGHHYFGFDNFGIDAGEPDDILPLEIILSDAGDCGTFSPAETISVVIENTTCRPLYNVPVDIQINGGAVVTEIMPGPIPSFGFYIYTFTNTFDLSAVGTHTISVTTNLATDSVPGNDNIVEVRYSGAPIAAYPYVEDFNSDNGGWVSRTPSNTRLFVLDTLDYLNGPQGEGDSWFVRTSATNDGSWIWVESPVFDFSGLSSPQLYVDIKHQLHNSDYFRVEYSLNGGTSWVPLGSTEPNWYNTNGYWRNSIANPVDEWTKVQKSLCDLAGEPCVKFRFRGRPFYSEPTYTGHHYFAFDNVEIIEGGDVGVVAYIEPVDQGCLYNAAQNVTVEVFNFGCQPESNVPVTCDVSGVLNTTLVGTVPGPIPANSSVNYTFPATIDMTAVGTYDFKAYTQLATDIKNDNDTSLLTIDVNQVTISTFPYEEDFNSGNGYWLSSGSNPPFNQGRNFVLGNLPYLNGPQGQGDSWYVETTVSNQGAWVWVESPVFDFSTLTNPKLEFDIKHQLHNSDYFQVQYSVNGGVTWIQLGSGPDPEWYNGTNYWRNSISSPVDEWLRVSLPVCALAGESCVKFRVRGRPFYSEPTYTGHHYFAFDNVRITDTQIDAELTFIDGCYGSEYFMEVTVFNNNKLCLVSDTINSIDITYTIDGGAPVTQTFNGLSIPFGQSQTIEIPNVTVPSPSSVITAWCQLPNGTFDEIVHNDTMSTTAALWQDCNDHCTNATQLGIGSTTISQTSNATNNPGVDPLFPCGNPTLENTVWYFFETDSIGGQVELQITNTICTPSSNGIQVSINEITGAPCDSANYTNVYCANNGNTNDLIWGPVTLPPNTLYYITIDGYAGNDCDFDITLLGSVVPLPVELSDFGATCQNGRVVVTWGTESEYNNDYFIVERSEDGISFETVEIIQGQGTTNSAHNYIVVDDEPRNGVSYYRLSQVDFDGTLTYSEVVAANCDDIEEGISVYPNPSTGNSSVSVHLNETGTGLMQVVDSRGKIVYEKYITTISENMIVPLNGTELAPGLYQVRLLTENNQYVEKWIITQN
jgi:hypothetical protein